MQKDTGVVLEKLKKKNDGKSITIVINDTHNYREEYLESKKKYYQNLFYLRSTKRYKENPKYSKVNFENFVNEEYRKKIGEVTKGIWIWVHRLSCTERYGYNFIHDIYSQCSKMNRENAIEEIAKLKKPSNAKKEEILDRYKRVAKSTKENENNESDDGVEVNIEIDKTLKLSNINSRLEKRIKELEADKERLIAKCERLIEERDEAIEERDEALERIEQIEAVEV